MNAYKLYLELHSQLKPFKNPLGFSPVPLIPLLIVYEYFIDIWLYLDSINIVHMYIQNRRLGTLLLGRVYILSSLPPEPKGIVVFNAELRAKFLVYLCWKCSCTAE